MDNTGPELLTQVHRCATFFRATIQETLHNLEPSLSAVRLIAFDGPTAARDQLGETEYNRLVGLLALLGEASLEVRRCDRGRATLKATMAGEAGDVAY